MELTDKLIQSYMEQEVNPPCISLYLPTHPKSTSQRMNEDRIRLKNLLQDLEERDVFSSELTTTHSQLRQLLDDSDFWLHQSESLALFADSQGFTTVRLPYELTAASYIGDRYALSPLLLMQNMGQTFYLVDLDFQHPRLYAGNVRSLEEVTDAGLPDGIEVQTELAGATDVDDQQIHNINRYLNRVAEAVTGYLSDKSGPLFIIGSSKSAAEFRSQLDYEQVIPGEIATSYDSSQSRDIHATASKQMADIAQATRSDAIERYGNTDFDLRADGMTAITAAADQGKVDTLLLPVLRLTTDGVDSDNQPAPLVELPEDFATFDSVVRKVAEQSGTIIAVEQADFADDPSMKAILRF